VLLRIESSEMAAARFPILMYHQIDAIAPRYISPGVRARHRGLTVSPSSFARQMWLLKVFGYRGVSMSELMPYLRGERSGKVVGITFDDGYKNNLEHALPILNRFGFSSTCYVVSGLIGGSNVWDREKNVAEKPLMTADELRRWVSAEQEIGAHTRTHVKLADVEVSVARDEILGCKRELESVIGAPCKHFCYPYGSYAPEHVELVREAGFESATTTVEQAAQGSDDPLLLPRRGIFKKTGALGLLLRVVGFR
jgi:peptidoglycan/xylan/chitin deacetylase (PgdA/CDA1 family)